MAGAYILGLGTLGTIWLLIALLGWFSPLAIALIITPLAIGGAFQVAHKRQEIIAWLRRHATEFGSHPAGLKIIAGLTMLFGLSGITFLGQSVYGDGAGFYLALAKIISTTHSMKILPGYESLMSAGLSGELHFAALLSMGNPAAIQVLPWMATLGGGFLLVGLAKLSDITRSGQWLFFAMLLSSSAVVEIAGIGKTDLFAFAYGISAYYWLLASGKDQKEANYLIVGLSAGYAIVAKISYAASFLPSLCLLLIWSQGNQNGWAGFGSLSSKKILTSAGRFLLGSIIAIIPHLIKNQVLLGNFLLPFDGNASAWQFQEWHGPDTTRRILLTLPFSLTFGNFWAQFGNLTPLVLAYLPLCLIAPRPPQILKKPISILTLAGILGSLTWFILRPSVFAPRYILASLVLLMIPSAWAADHYLTSSRSTSKAIRFMITCSAIVTLLSSWFYNLNLNFFPVQTLQYLKGDLEECEKEPRYCGLITTINEITPQGSRLFTYALIRYWLRPDLIQCALTSSEKDAFLDLETSEQRWSFIYGRGFQWVPIFNTGNRMEILVMEDLDHIPEWLSVSWIDDRHNLLLRIDSRDNIRQPGVGCGPDALTSWSLFDRSEMLIPQ
jgi:hypothetical protein